MRGEELAHLSGVTRPLEPHGMPMRKTGFAFTADSLESGRFLLQFAESTHDARAHSKCYAIDTIPVIVIEPYSIRSCLLQ
ncbi:hypothetical protein B0G84_6351 [Paraburkholderia sp. BL8N3]|jgi:hypothetical protein|nr:hypothetical protein B0G84_6351 [Paraburkholderia sp. BL8N3]